MNIIPDIATLKTVVKINASIPYDAVLPFINDALDIYIEPQVGAQIIALASDGNDASLTDKVLRSLGPLTLALATHEFGIMYGDSGITVDNQQGKRSPANEAKIASARENLFFRGMQALDRLLIYLERNKQSYPDYVDHLNITQQTPCFIRSAEEYQNIGLVNIDFSMLTYRTMLPTLLQLQERNVRDMLGDTLYNSLLTGSSTDTLTTILKEHVIRYLANKSAELYTSQTTRQERSNAGSTMPEYKPIIRPIYQDMTDTGNFFAMQATYYEGRITTYLSDNADAFGVSKTDTAMHWNSKEKKIFTSIT
jgi:hypothetical protein